ncbi:hypothetical protein NDU88_003938 [Pleurodeles waltl]|uniref:Uncharacterized protein n=1 Tax=Pleurodeles waltl TaxID=8319 RepID=A0AAV7KXY0_PLEWA|nr:hypothetical protein NDU88_003938 [Pleurodeles waltl]
MVAVGTPCWAAAVGALWEQSAVLWYLPYRGHAEGSVCRVSTGQDYWGKITVKREEMETRFVVVRDYRQYCSLMEKMDGSLTVKQKEKTECSSETRKMEAGSTDPEDLLSLADLPVLTTHNTFPCVAVDEIDPVERGFLTGESNMQHEIPVVEDAGIQNGRSNGWNTVQQKLDN